MTAEPGQVEITRRLAAAGCVAPEAEAVELLAAAHHQAADDPTWLEAALGRRQQGEPLAWITGRATFAGLVLSIVPGVYVPRAQTEELARRAAARLPVGGRLLDLCTGGGAVAAWVKAQSGGARVVGIDLDPRAAACARRNGVTALVGDLAEPVRPGRRFDVISAVAPYVPRPELAFLPADVVRYEPTVALDGGGDGLDLVRRVVADAAARLVPGGWLITELGGAQDTLLEAWLGDRGFDRVEPWHDEDDDLRGIQARWSG